MPPPPVQTEIGKYRLLRKIATGGMAEVYLAQTSGPAGFQKTLVLKRILPHLAEDANFVQMFLNEARLAALLNHPNIVQIFDLGEADGSHYIAMEYIDGPNLRMLSRKAAETGKVVPFEHAAKIVSMACEGLNYAHDFSDGGQPLGLIHRDISPDNILISRTGAVKVVDFGIAKAANQGHTTKTGTLKGKLAYMPPEQLRGKPLDRRADIFALGVVLYEMIAGMKPFDATSEIAAMQAILHDPPTPLNERRPDCPAELVIIVERALEKEKENRYPDCRAMQRDIEQFLISRRKSIGPYELAQLVIDIVPPTPIPVHHTPLPGAMPREVSAHTPPEAPAPRPRPSRPEIPAELGDTIRIPSQQELAALTAGRETVNERPETAGRSTVRDAPFPEPPKRKNRAVVLGVVAGLGVAALAGGYLALQGRARDLAGPDAALALAAAPARLDASREIPPEPPAPEPPDAAVVEAATEPGRDAGTASVTPVRGPKTRPPRPPIARHPDEPGPKLPPPPPPVVDSPKPALIAIDADPPCSVSLNGKPIGTTPVEARNLAAGTYSVVVSNAEKKLTRMLSLTVAAGEERREKLKFVPGTLIFRVQPWAFVEVDGRPQGQTPIPDGVQVFEGDHRVRLFNPELKKEVVRQVQVKPGAKEVVKVNFLDD